MFSKKLAYAHFIKAGFIEYISQLDTCGGGGGFFLACEDFERMFDHSFLAWAFFLSFFLSFSP